MIDKQKNSKNSASQFPKGISGNPAGRPPGSRNKATLLMEALLEGEADQLTRKVIELGKKGDINALRICLDRLLPPRKDRAIQLRLHPIENLPQISVAMSTVVEAIGDGRITPNEGEVLANILAVQTDVLATGDLDRRVTDLEQALSAHKKEKADQGAIDLIQRLRDGWTPSEVDSDHP